MKIGFIAIAGAASLVASADAGLAGFVALSRNVGANTVIDVFAAVENASDKFLNVYDLTASGTFVQKAGLSSKTWKPDAANFTSTRSVSDDSFMTAGTFSGGAYGGEYYASGNTTADPNFTGTTWNGTPASAAATTIPALAGWFSNDPPSVDNNSEALSSAVAGATRANSTKLSGYGPADSSGATRGIWIAHLVIAGTNKVIGVDFTWSGSASIKDGVTGNTTQGAFSFAAIPAPGALALLGIAGFASRRRRA